MRAIDCPCGHRLEGADDEELCRKAREHVDRDHPEMERTDEELRERVAADAYDVAEVADEHRRLDARQLDDAGLLPIGRLEPRRAVRRPRAGPSTQPAPPA